MCDAGSVLSFMHSEVAFSCQDTELNPMYAKPVRVTVSELCGSGNVSKRARKKSNVQKLIICH